MSVAETSDPEEEPEIALNLVSSIDFKCDQYVYGNTIQKDLAQHKQIKHRIYQVDGAIDSDEKTKHYYADDKVTLPAKEEEPVVLKTNSLRLLDCTEIYWDVTPPAGVSNPKMGIGYNPWIQ